MNGDDFWNFTVLGAVLVGCLFYIGRSLIRTFRGGSGGRCFGCSRGKTCVDSDPAGSENTET
jgi:hypothetical protein